MFKKKFNYLKNQSTHDLLIISLSDDCTKPITAGDIGKSYFRFHVIMDQKYSTGETLSAEIPLSNPIGLLSFKAAVKKLMYLLDLEEMGEFWDHVNFWRKVFRRKVCDSAFLCRHDIDSIVLS